MLCALHWGTALQQPFYYLPITRRKGGITHEALIYPFLQRFFSTGLIYRYCGCIYDVSIDFPSASSAGRTVKPCKLKTAQTRSLHYYFAGAFCAVLLFMRFLFFKPPCKLFVHILPVPAFLYIIQPVTVGAISKSVVMLYACGTGYYFIYQCC